MQREHHSRSVPLFDILWALARISFGTFVASFKPVRWHYPLIFKTVNSTCNQVYFSKALFEFEIDLCASEVVFFLTAHRYFKQCVMKTKKKMSKWSDCCAVSLRTEGGGTAESLELMVKISAALTSQHPTLFLWDIKMFCFLLPSITFTCTATCLQERWADREVFVHTGLLYIHAGFEFNVPYHTTVTVFCYVTFESFSSSLPTRSLLHNFSSSVQTSFLSLIVGDWKDYSGDYIWQDYTNDITRPWDWVEGKEMHHGRWRREQTLGLIEITLRAKS